MENLEETEQIEQEENLPLQPSPKRKYMLIGVIATLVVLIVGMGILVFLIQKETTTQPEIAESEALPIDPITNWQTYRNDEFGFEFKYPAKLDTEFIRVDTSWPPSIVVQYSTQDNICYLPSQEVLINNRTYCVSVTADDTAAGTFFYRQFQYTSQQKEGKYIIMNFTLAYPHCGAYRDSQQQESCTVEEQTFIPYGLAYQILSTFRFTEEVDFVTFGGKQILKAMSFMNSKEEEKNFIIVQTEQFGGYGAEAYLVDADYSQDTAVKVQGVFTSIADMLISVSPSSGEKFLFVSTFIADSSTGRIYKENGELVSEEVVGNALELVKDKCQCGFRFDSWKDKDSFYVVIPTGGGETYRILIDATTGKPIGLPEEV